MQVVFTSTLACIIFIVFAEGTIYSTQFDETCDQLPQFHSYGVQSDACAMLYRDNNCKSTHKIKVVPEEFTSTNTTKHWKFGSVQKCNNLDGGQKLNVDVTEYQPVETRNISNYVPLVLYSYKDVCTCVNLPSELQNMKEWSINNHGNEVLVYFDQNCLDERKYGDIIGIDLQGVSDSIEISNRTKIDRNSNVPVRVQSFGPNPGSVLFRTRCNLLQICLRSIDRIRELKKTVEQLEENLREANKALLDEMGKKQEYQKMIYGMTPEQKIRLGDDY